MKTYTFRAIIEPDQPSGYHGFVPLLRGLHTCGETIEETKKNLKGAIKCHIEGLLKAGEKIPQEEETIEIIQTFSEQDFKRSFAYA